MSELGSADLLAGSQSVVSKCQAPKLSNFQRHAPATRQSIFAMNLHNHD